MWYVTISRLCSPLRDTSLRGTSLKARMVVQRDVIIVLKMLSTNQVSISNYDCFTTYL